MDTKLSTTKNIFPQDKLSEYLRTENIPELLSPCTIRNHSASPEDLLRYCESVLEFLQLNNVYSGYKIPEAAFQGLFEQFEIYYQDQSARAKYAFDFIKVEQALYLLTDITATQDISSYLLLVEENCEHERILELIKLLYRKYDTWADGHSEGYVKWMHFLAPYMNYLASNKFDFPLDPKSSEHTSKRIINKTYSDLRAHLAERNIDITFQDLESNDLSHSVDQLKALKDVVFTDKAGPKDNQFYFGLGQWSLLMHILKFSDSNDTFLRICLSIIPYFDIAVKLAEASQGKGLIKSLENIQNIIENQVWKESLVSGLFSDFLGKNRVAAFESLFSSILTKENDDLALYLADSQGSEPLLVRFFSAGLTKRKDLENLMSPYFRIFRNYNEYYIWAILSIVCKHISKLDRYVAYFADHISKLVRESRFGLFLQSKAYSSLVLLADSSTSLSQTIPQNLNISEIPLKNIIDEEGLKDPLDLFLNLRYTLAFFKHNKTADKVKAAELKEVVKKCLNKITGDVIAVDEIEYLKHLVVFLLELLSLGKVQIDIKIQVELICSIVNFLVHKSINIWEALSVQKSLFSIIGKSMVFKSVILNPSIIDLFKVLETQSQASRIHVDTLDSKAEVLRNKEVKNRLYDMIATSIQKNQKALNDLWNNLEWDAQATPEGKQKLMEINRQCMGYIYFTLGWLQVLIVNLEPDKCPDEKEKAIFFLKAILSFYFHPAIFLAIGEKEGNVIRSVIKDILELDKYQKVRVAFLNELSRVLLDKVVVLNKEIYSTANIRESLLVDLLLKMPTKSISQTQNIMFECIAKQEFEIYTLIDSIYSLKRLDSNAELLRDKEVKSCIYSMLVTPIQINQETLDDLWRKFEWETRSTPAGNQKLIEINRHCAKLIYFNLSWVQSLIANLEPDKCPEDNEKIMFLKKKIPLLFFHSTIFLNTGEREDYILQSILRGMFDLNKHKKTNLFSLNEFLITLVERFTVIKQEILSKSPLNESLLLDFLFNMPKYSCISQSQVQDIVLECKLKQEFEICALVNSVSSLKRFFACEFAGNYSFNKDVFKNLEEVLSSICVFIDQLKSLFYWDNLQNEDPTYSVKKLDAFKNVYITFMQSFSTSDVGSEVQLMVFSYLLNNLFSNFINCSPEPLFNIVIGLLESMDFLASSKAIPIVFSQAKIFPNLLIIISEVLKNKNAKDTKGIDSMTSKINIIKRFNKFINGFLSSFNDIKKIKVTLQKYKVGISPDEFVSQMFFLLAKALEEFPFQYVLCKQDDSLIRETVFHILGLFEKAYTHLKQNITTEMKEIFCSKLDFYVIVYSFSNSFEQILPEEFNTARLQAFNNLVNFLHSFTLAILEENNSKSLAEFKEHKQKEAQKKREFLDIEVVQNRCINQLLTVQTYLKFIINLATRFNFEVEESLIRKLFFATIALLDQLSSQTTDQNNILKEEMSRNAHISRELCLLVNQLLQLFCTYFTVKFLEGNVSNFDLHFLYDWLILIVNTQQYFHKNHGFSVLSLEGSSFKNLIGLSKIILYLEPGLAIANDCEMLHRLLSIGINEAWTIDTVSLIVFLFDVLFEDYLPHNMLIENRLKRYLMESPNISASCCLAKLKNDNIIKEHGKYSSNKIASVLLEKFKLSPSIHETEAGGKSAQNNISFALDLAKEEKDPISNIQKTLDSLSIHARSVIHVLISSLVDNQLYNLAKLSEIKEEKFDPDIEFRNTTGISTLISILLNKYPELLVSFAYEKRDLRIFLNQYAQKVPFMRNFDAKSFESITYLDILFKTKWFIYHIPDFLLILRSVISCTGVIFIDPEDSKSVIDFSRIVVNEIIEKTTQELDNRNKEPTGTVENCLGFYASVVLFRFLLDNCPQKNFQDNFGRCTRMALNKLLGRVIEVLSETHGPLHNFGEILPLLCKLTQDYYNIHIDIVNLSKKTINQLKEEHYEAFLMGREPTTNESYIKLSHSHINLGDSIIRQSTDNVSLKKDCKIQAENLLRFLMKDPSFTMVVPVVKTSKIFSDKKWSDVLTGIIQNIYNIKTIYSHTKDVEKSEKWIKNLASYLEKTTFDLGTEGILSPVSPDFMDMKGSPLLNISVCLQNKASKLEERFSADIYQEIVDYLEKSKKEGVIPIFTDTVLEQVSTVTEENKLNHTKNENDRNSPLHLDIEKQAETIKGSIFSEDICPQKEISPVKEILPKNLYVLQEPFSFDDCAVHYAIGLLYIDYKNLRERNPSALELMNSLCDFPCFEVKFVNFCLFFLYLFDHVQTIFKAFPPPPELSTVNPQTVSDWMSIYNVVALNILKIMRNFIIPTRKYLLYQPLVYFERYGLKSLLRLKKKAFDLHTAGMVSVLDLLVGLLDIKELSSQPELLKEIEGLLVIGFSEQREFDLQDPKEDEKIDKPRVITKRSGQILLKLNYKVLLSNNPDIIASCSEEVISQIERAIEELVLPVNDTIKKLKAKRKAGSKAFDAADIGDIAKFKSLLGNLTEGLSLSSSTITKWYSKRFQNATTKSQENNHIYGEFLQNIKMAVLKNPIVERFFIFMFDFADLLSNDYNDHLPELKLIANDITKICLKFYILNCIKDYTSHDIPMLFDAISSDIPHTITDIPKLKFSISQLKDFDLDLLFANMCRKYRHVILELLEEAKDKKEGMQEMRLICRRLPWLLDFEDKKMMLIIIGFFRQDLENELKNIGVADQRRSIIINRKDLIKSLVNEFCCKNPIEIKERIKVSFAGESGIDEGGLRTELMSIANKELFDPEEGFFQLSENKIGLQPSPAAKTNPSYLKYFELAGIMLAKAIQEGCVVDINLTKPFLKQILNRYITINDLEDVDSDYVKNLRWILENPVEDLCLCFTYEVEILGQKVTKELVPGGYHIEVTEENKREYVAKVCEAKMKVEIKEQIEAFLTGFYRIIPSSFLDLFSPSELQLLISGARVINVEELKLYADYDESSDIITWLWEVLFEFSQKELAAFIFFTTGSVKLPINWYKQKKLTFKLVNKGPENLPIAHTCFWALEIPSYTSKDELRQKLLLAIFEGQEGFLNV